LFRINIVLVD